jgi:ZIP family zinc transporter
MDIIILAILGLVTFFSTLIGGLITFKFKKYLPYFFAFAAGSLIGVSFLDLLPESLNLANSIQFPIRNIMIMILASFFIYSMLEKFFLTHEIEEEGHGHILGPIGAGSLVLHSFLDGAAIGSAFQVNFSIGVIVAFAVIFHDFTDGINTVTIMLKNNHNSRNAKIFLLLDAIAPILGILLTSIIMIPQHILALILAFFVGEFIYMGAVSLLPEAHKHHSKKTILFVLLGILLIFALTSFLKI